MDPDRFRAAYQHLQGLDERLSHKVRPRSHRSFARATHEQLEERVRDLAEYTLELKEVMNEMFEAIAAAPAAEGRTETTRTEETRTGKSQDGE